MLLHVKDNVYYTGIRDWELRMFHGHELSTFNGSSYNSYLIKDDKTVLLDTVWAPHTESFLNTLEAEVGIANIDMVIVNHNEPDHGGSIVALLEKNPNIEVVCSQKGVEIIKKHFQNPDWNFHPVKTGDTINIGKSDLTFVEMTMIHWPDSMMTFMSGSNILFSNDAFGQHFCGPSIFADKVDACLVWAEAFKYFAGILSPFTALIKRKVAEVVAMNLPLEMIAPSHGVIWREDVLKIVEKYAEWSDDYDEGCVTVGYDTMYQATKKMAEAIAQGIEEEGVPVKLFNTAASDQSDLMTEFFRSKGIVLGSSTVNNGTLRSLAGVVDEIRGHKLKGKIGFTFGSYGWSGEAPKHLQEGLTEAGISIVQDPVMAKYTPSAEELLACKEAGKAFAVKILNG